MPRPREHRPHVVCARCNFYRRDAGRGLCDRCYQAVRAAGNLSDYPRRLWSSAELVAEAELLRARYGPAEGRAPIADPDTGRFLGATPPAVGRTWPQIAEELGVSPAALDKARQRVAQRRRAEAAERAAARRANLTVHKGGSVGVPVHVPGRARSA
jgi:hypothetical protein